MFRPAAPILRHAAELAFIRRRDDTMAMPHTRHITAADLAKARAFYEAVGATNNPQFTDETAACMVFSEAIHVMLLTHDKWRQFTQKPIVDARR